MKGIERKPGTTNSPREWIGWAPMSRTPLRTPSMHRVVGLHLVHELDHDLAARGRLDAIGELHLFIRPCPS